MIENMTKEEIEEFKELNKPHKFIRENNLEQLQILIDNGLDINKIDSKGQILLGTAIVFHNLEAVKLLIENGADVNLTTNNLPLITLALIYGDIELFRLLIENGVDVNAVGNNRPIILHALMYGYNEVVELLVENGAEIEFPNSNTTLLEQALLYSNDEIIELCIKKGSKFPQHILFDVAKAKDGYVFNRELLTIMINEKSKLRTNLEMLEEDFEKIIQTKESTIEIINKTKNKMYEMKKVTAAEEENIIIDDFMKKNNNEINKHSLDLNIQHKRLNKIKINLTNMINRISDMQDKMTTSKIIDFIKTFIKYGGDVNYKDKDGSTVLMLLSYYGYEDCVKMLIENGAQIDIQNSGIETPLLLAYENNQFHVVKLLIESGADVNITMDNGESFYKKAKYDKNYEILECIENSPTYIKITHDPIELVKILSNFRKDEPMKYTTHDWDSTFMSNFEVNYKDFKGYIETVKSQQWSKIDKDLKTMSRSIHQKIYNFLFNQDKSCKSWCTINPEINIGWSNLDGLEEWCNKGNKPSSYKLHTAYYVNNKTITTFGEIIELFKHEIQIRKSHKVFGIEDILEDIFIEIEERLDEENGGIFNFTTKNLLGKEFYTDVEKLKEVLEDRIFKEIKSKTDFTEINIEAIDNIELNFIELKIIQVGSQSNLTAEEMIHKGTGGDTSIIKENLQNLCDWSIESSKGEENYRINYLKSDNNIEQKQLLDYKPLGFTHILRFYK
jgi:ankyrin repeat protein